VNEPLQEVGVLEATPPPSVPPVPSPPVKAGPVRRAVGAFGRLLPMAFALACVAGLVFLGRETGWSVPKLSALRGEEGSEKEGDWCAEHGVPESECVECDPSLLPRKTGVKWDKEFGVHESPLRYPEVAETPVPPTVTPEDWARARRAVSFAPRVENNPKCKLHERRIQLASEEVVKRLGIVSRPVATGPVVEGVTAPGETGYAPTRVARLSARVPGAVFRVEKQVGDRVRRGEVLVLVDAAEVGKAKAEFLQALTQVDLKVQTLERLKALSGASVPGQSVIEAEAALEEARVRLVTAEQALGNLGLTIRAADVRGFSPADLTRRMQFLGIPDPLAKELAGKTASSNLLPVTSPLDGEVVSRSVAGGETADPTKVLFVVADTSHLWLTLRVRMEDAPRLRPGQPVRFEHAGHEDGDGGAVVWVSPTADEKTRTVAVRVDLPNLGGTHRAGTFGTARVLLREEKNAVIVPSEAVHWEGDCNVVFVRDRNFEKPGAPKVFHVRTVRPGGQDVAQAGPVTEIAAGLLPGEWVAVTNSGVLRSELLKNNLGAG
jgi:cobalt-zinc-cadmium efflux system membrane fusion protein